MASHWRIMLNRGGMRSLVATAMQPQPERLSLVYVHEGRVSDEVCHAAANEQVEHYDVGRLLELSMPHLVDETGVPPRPEGDPADVHAVAHRDPLGAVQLVVAACALAIRSNADRVIWPAQVGEDHDAIARVTETLGLIGDIVRIEHGRDVAIETPLLEMTDRELVEVGHQMSVPWETARTCHAGRGDACGACSGCQRRNAAFAAAGIEDPLHLAHARN